MGLLPPPPREIQGAELKVQYISVLAQAQQMIGVSSIERNLNFGIQMAQANPEILDNYNFDTTAREYAKAIGAPAKTMSSPEERDAKRQANREAAAQAAKMEQMQAGAEMASKAAGAMKAAGQTPVGTGSALDKITEAAPGAK
jgi:hypothetical protein